jgi:hypothetical protein
MTEQLKSPEPGKITPIEEVVSGIVLRDKSLFFPKNDGPDNFSLLRTWQVGLIRQAGDGLEDLPAGTSIVTVEFKRIRRDRGPIFYNIDFLYTGDTLLPLGTHVFKNHSFKAYQLDFNNNVTSEVPLEDFLIAGIDQPIVLTRTLSEGEAAKYAKGSEDLGSSRSPIWTDAIYTTVHNITNEFHGKGYEKVIKFILNRDELKSLLAKKAIKVGTYAYMFPGRDTDSPFPFDFEIKFERGGFPSLVEGYRRWVSESGIPYLDNPFYRG